MRVEGMLDSPASFKDLVVRKVGAGLYKYEAVCPDHGDKFVDFTTISAHVARDGVVEIERVTKAFFYIVSLYSTSILINS